MALHLTPAEHDLDPPSGWVVRKAGERVWQLCGRDGGVIATAKTKKEAEGLRVAGPYVDLYNDEGRWFRGEQVRNWKPYVPRQNA